MADAAARITGVKQALKLVPVASLSTYEQPDRRKVAEIAVSLQRNGRLINPVVVDLERSLLIDGHHRVKAFSWLGLSHIACYDVDYLSARVEVRDWRRVTTASTSAVAEAFELLGGERAGSWTVVASHAQRVVAQRAFADAVSSARYLEHVSMCLAAMGHPVSLEAAEPSPNGRIHSRVTPVVGKAEVLAAVETGTAFPQEVNRHLVEDRPLAMDIPLSSLRSVATFDGYLDEFFAHAPAACLGPGHWHAGRFYEERVVTFDANAG